MLTRPTPARRRRRDDWHRSDGGVWLPGAADVPLRGAGMVRRGMGFGFEPAGCCCGKSAIYWEDDGSMSVPGYTNKSAYTNFSDGVPSDAAAVFVGIGNSSPPTATRVASDSLAGLAAWLDAGGRVGVIGHCHIAAYPTYTDNVNALIGVLGGEAVCGTTNSNPGNPTTNINSVPGVMSGIDQLEHGRSNAISGGTWLAKTLSEAAIFMTIEQVGSGFLVVIANLDFIYDTTYDSLLFVKNFVTNSADNLL